MGRLTRLTIIQKVALGYLLTGFFGLFATIYAMGSLSSQTEQSNELINGDYRALILATTIRQDLLALDRLEKAEDILTDVDLGSMHQRRREDFRRNWSQLSQLPLSQALPQPLEKAGGIYATKLDEPWEKNAEGKSVSGDFSPLRTELLKQIDLFMHSREEIIDDSLADLTTDSSRSYRITLLLMLLGMGLGIAAVASVVRAMHRQTRNLIDATTRIAHGEYDCQIDTRRNDEFGKLAKAFVSMSDQLQHLEQMRLDANPLTHLPGNMAIDHEINRRIELNDPFAHIYIDIDNFKSFNDRYGYQEGDKAIALVRDIIKEILLDIGSTDHLLGHIGGDDYVVLTTRDKVEPLVQKLIKTFDEQAPLLYNSEDRAAGYIIGRDRQDKEVRHPLITLSIAVVTTESLSQPSPAAISRECAKIKHHLKKLPGSNYLIDRREGR